MELPNKSKAYVPANKILGYLLSETHSVGKSKAKFFRSLGFGDNEANLLEQELIKIAQTNDIQETINTPHGKKYIVDGQITTPNSVIIWIRTIWITETGENRPRLVTAYPPD